jgi:hypothetical protein
VVSFGYWGMFSVSERSQVKRLTTILEQGSILQEGKIQGEVEWLRDSLPKRFLAIRNESTNESKLTDSLHNEVMSILSYLDDHHGFTSIRPWFDQDLDSMVKENNNKKTRWMRLSEAEAYMRTMGLKYDYRYPGQSTRYYSYQSAFNSVADVHGYNYLIRLSHEYDPQDSVVYSIGGTKYAFVYPRSNDNKVLLASSTDSLQFETDELLTRLIAKYGDEYDVEIPIEQMSLTTESKKLTAKLEIDQLSFEATGDTLRIYSVKGNILLRIKE